MKTKRRMIVWENSFTDTIENIESFIIERLQYEYNNSKFDKYQVEFELNWNSKIVFARYIFDETGIEDANQQIREAMTDNMSNLLECKHNVFNFLKLKHNIFNFLKFKHNYNLDSVKSYEELKHETVTIVIKIETEKFEF